MEYFDMFCALMDMGFNAETAQFMAEDAMVERKLGEVWAG
jgi:hypothetical protein